MSRFVLYLEDDSQHEALERALTRAGMTVVVCHAVGMDGKTDPEQLAFASARGYVICTANFRDFAVLHRDYQERGLRHSGIIVRTRQQFSIGEQARRIIRIWEAISAEDMVNRTESLSQWGDERDA